VCDITVYFKQPYKNNTIFEEKAGLHVVFEEKKTSVRGRVSLMARDKEGPLSSP
jgi:hypothetical protein